MKATCDYCKKEIEVNDLLDGMIDPDHFICVECNEKTKVEIEKRERERWGE
jgi:hypothetical protein